MFSFADTPVKFVGLLVLFALCTVWCGYELTRPQDVRQRISNWLHLVMAVVMLLMVVPATWAMLVAVIPAFGLVAVFALGTIWFGWLAVRSRRGTVRNAWLHFAGHATMFAAMTWHLSAMGVVEAAMAHGPASGMGEGSGMDAGSGGMDAGGMANLGGTMQPFALIGLPLMVYLLAASMWSLWQTLRPAGPAAAGCPCGPACDCGPGCSCYATRSRAAAREPELVPAGSGAPAYPQFVEAAVSTRTCHEVRPVGTVKFRLESLAGFAMNFGMFWMSTGLIVPLLPFLSALAF